MSPISRTICMLIKSKEAVSIPDYTPNTQYNENIAYDLLTENKRVVGIKNRYEFNCNPDDDKEYDFISKISKTAQPSKADIIRYRCWLEQKAEMLGSADAVVGGGES